MEFKPGKTVGIDLGTTFSTIAHLTSDGEPVAIANDEGQVETPSLILLAESGHVVVGPNRVRAAMEDPDNVVERIKREMGDAGFKRTFDGREITPEFLSGLILKKLKQDAEKQVGTIGNAVITVPYYFTDSRRKATEDAGQIAGLNVIDIINEPTAATLAYAWQQGILGRGEPGEKPRRAMVYDLGGGTFDVTVVEYTSTRFRVLATDGDVHLGGVDWNERLVDHVAKEFEERFGSDPRKSPASLQILRNDCDLAKIKLSEAEEAKIPCRHQGRSIHVKVTREDFERMTADLLQRTLDTCDLVLEHAGAKSEEMEAIVLVGGSTLMPAVGPALERMLGVKPYTGMSPHLAVAHGAAIHAAILEARYRGEESELAEPVRRHLTQVRQEDVNSHGLGIAAVHPNTGKTINHVMIPRNTRLPASVKQTLYTRYEGQRRVNVRVIEGDAPDPDACAQIGNCVVNDLPAGLPQGSPVEVTYEFDRNGRVRVRAIDQAGGRKGTVEIHRRGLLSDGQIDAYARLAADYEVE